MVKCIISHIVHIFIAHIVLVLVDTQEGSIVSTLLRCDQIYLLIAQEVFLSAMVVPGTRTFVYPPRHRAFDQ